MQISGQSEPDAGPAREGGFDHILFESLPVGILACDAEGRLTLSNSAAREWFGGNLVGITLDEWANHHGLYRDDGTTPLPAKQSPLIRALRGEKLTAESLALITPGKPVRFLSASAGPVQDAEGRRLGAVVTLCDVTKLRRQAVRVTELEETNRNLRAELEAQQREKEQAGRERALLRCILDSANDLIFIKDRNGVYQGCNRASENFLGLSESEQIGKTDYDFFDAEAVVPIQAADRQVMETGKPVRSEEWVAYADGHKALMDTVKVPCRGPNGELLGLVGIARDITEHIRAQEALKESKARYMDLRARRRWPDSL